MFLLCGTASDIWLNDPCIEIAGVGGADSSKLKGLETFLQALLLFWAFLLTKSDELSHISQNQGQNRASEPVLRFSPSMLRLSIHAIIVKHLRLDSRNGTHLLGQVIKITPFLVFKPIHSDFTASPHSPCNLFTVIR